MSPGGFLLVLILWGISATPGRFTRGVYYSGKAISLAREALLEEGRDECLRIVRESVLQSFLFKTYLRFNSKTMRVPEDDKGFMAYFRQTFLPEQAGRLRRLEGRKSRLGLGAVEALIIAAPIVFIVLINGLGWIGWSIGAALLLISMAWFFHIYERLVKKEEEYAEMMGEVNLKLIGLEKTGVSDIIIGRSESERGKHDSNRDALKDPPWNTRLPGSCSNSVIPAVRAGGRDGG